MTKDDHKDRHKLLHEMLDELLADFIAHRSPFEGTVLDQPIIALMAWSHEQARCPTLARLEQKEGAGH